MTKNLPDTRSGLPPPAELHLVDDDHVAGWLTSDAVGFGGFDSAHEAAHAAWVAHRTLARRLARTHGTRPTPITTEPLAIRHERDRDVILASGREIAKLLRPSSDHPPVSDSFGFEIPMPPSASELEARAVAYLIYRSLRKSGVRWALWRAAANRPDDDAMKETLTSRRTPMNALRTPDRWASPSSVRNGDSARPRPSAHALAASDFVAKVIFSALGLVAAIALITAAPSTVVIPIAVVLLAGVAITTLATAPFKAATVRWRSRLRDKRRPSSSLGIATRAALGGTTLALLLLLLAVPIGLGLAVIVVALTAFTLFRMTTAARDGVPLGFFTSLTPPRRADGADSLSS